VYLGEFGVYEAAPAESRTRYIRAVSEAAADLGWGWCVWSYNGGMAVRDTAGRPTPVLAGLFPNGRPAR
jgi:endoglucanase